MKKNFKVLTVLGLAALTVGTTAVLASCTTDNPTSTTGGDGTTEPTSGTTTTSEYTATEGDLVVSGPATQLEWLQETLGEFNDAREAEGLAKINFGFETHGEDKVDSEVGDWTRGPDVYAYASDKIMPLYQKGALAEVPTEGIDMINAEMTEASLDAVTFANKVVSYPYAGDNGYFLYYNKDLITLEDTATIEGLLNKAVELNKKVAYPLNTPFYSAGALFTFGAGYTLTVDESGMVTSVASNFDEEAGILAGIAIYNIMTHAGYQETQAAPTEENGLIACVDGSWNAATYQAAMGDAYAATKLPTVTVEYNGETHTENLGSYLGYKNYGVNPLRSAGDADRLALAHEVAMYLSSEAVQESRFDAFQTAPTNTTVAALDKVVNNVAVKAINEQSEFATPQTAVPAAIWNAPQTFTQGIINNEVTLENIETHLQILNDAIEASK